MRVLKFLTVIAALLVAVFSTVVYISSIGKNDAPVLTCTVEETIEASVNATDEELLKYVTATDKQDGDITHKIKVIRKMLFIDDKTTLVTFAVCDSDNNVTTLQRILYLTDYVSPKFSLTSDFIFAAGYTYNLSQYVRATDTIDGELNDYVKIISPELSNSDGEYPVNIKVSNSMGDSAELTIKAKVTSEDYFSTKIRLNNYIAYTQVGSTVDYGSFVKDIYFNNVPRIYTVDDVKIDADGVDTSKAGVYDAYYRIYDDNGDVVTLTRLVVVVTED